MQELTINQRFKAIIPPLTSEEYQQLEANILKDGIREPISTWRGVIIDGHNRYEIAQKHGLQFDTKEYEFADENDVELWIIRNQLGRRNITAYARVELALKLKPIIAAKAKENLVVSTGGANPRPLPISAKVGINTRKEIAKAANIGHDTISKVEHIQAHAAPEIISACRTGEMSINQAYQEIKKEEKAQKLEEAKAAILAQTQKAVADNRPIIHYGNCVDFMDKDEQKFDLLLTDPPYSTDIDDMDSFIDRWYYEALSKVKPTGFAYIFIGAYPDELKAYLNAETPPHIKLTQVLVWTYKNTLGNNPKDRYKLNYQACLFFRGVDAPSLDCPITNEQWAVQEINAPDGRQGDRYHAWQKPMEIAERFIRHSTTVNAHVFDPFAGTGTFILAANKLGCIGVGCEIDKDTLAIAIERGCANE